MKALLIGSLLIAAPIAYAGEMEVATKTSKLVWHGKKVVGGSHEGTLNIKHGSISFDKQMPTAAKVVVDMTSLVNTDLTDPQWNKKLVDHLKSDDFFSIDKFPEATIELSSFDRQKNGTYSLKGDLTIKGIKKPISLTATTVQKAGSVSAIKATLVFDRTVYDVRYGSGKFFQNLGDKMISDEVKVDVTLDLKNPIKLSSN